jgi:hypothetical protein
MGFGIEVDKVLELKEIKEWNSYFFQSKHYVKSDESDFKLIYPGKVHDLHKTQESKIYKCNKSKTICLSIDLSFIIERKGNRYVYEGLGPDSTVYLENFCKSSVYQIYSLGSYGSIHGAVWYCEDVVVIYGFHQKNGFLKIMDLKNLKTSLHILDGKYRKSKSLIKEFLIRKYK